MNFKIVIPSKNRINVFKNNCLKFLIDSNLIKNEIYLFVDSLDIKSYKNEFDNKYNIKVIEGKTGLINQRNFIRDYFDEDTLLLHLDDDLKGVNYEGDLNEIIRNDFNNMIKKNILLGSINPTNNKLNKRNKILFGLYLCVGCYYYEINKKDKNLYLSNLFESEKEDYLRTITHYNFSGQVYRNDNLNVIHKYKKNDDGGMNNLNRLDNNNICCNYINLKYPNLTRIFYKNEGKRKEIKFKHSNQIFKKLYLDKKINSKLGEYFEIDNTFTNLDTNLNYKIYDKSSKVLLAVLIRNVLPIKNKDVNYDLLNKITKHGTCNRSNIAGPIEINKLDFSKERKEKIKEEDLIYINEEKTRCRFKDKKFQFSNKFQSNNLGYTRLRKEIKLNIQSKKYSEEFKNEFNCVLKTIDKWSSLYYPEIFNPVKSYLDTQFTGITINNNTRSANHYDCNNKGFCSIIVLGNFQGCELLFTDYKLNCNLNPNRDLLLFDSKNIKHSNSSYLGKDNNRFSLVFFKNRRCF